MSFNPAKRKFFRTEVVYLGHRLLLNKGILPDSAELQIIKIFPVPTNPDEVRRFVTIIAPNFAYFIKALNDLLKYGVKFIWNHSHQNSCNKLKQILISPKILRYPDLT